jgi:Fe-S-cluster containining protein
MKCEECKGACCEIMEIRFRDLQPPSEDVFRWMRLHGLTKVRDNLESGIEFECRCNALKVDGSCEIYEDRPEVCRTMPAGGEDCLNYVRERRTPEQFQRIRDDDDPISLI